MALSRRLGVFAAGLLVAALAPAADAPGRWTTADMLKYRLVSDVQVSPDGRRVAFVVRDSILDPDKSEYRTQVWLGWTDGRPAWPATFGDTSATQPRWSPDGARLSFLGKRGDKNVNVWLLPLSGGEAQRLTDAPADVSEAAWSPDGRWMAYIAADAPDAERERRERERDDARVVGSDDQPGRLWLVQTSFDASGKSEGRKLLATGFSVGATPGRAPGASISWAPDGKTLAFAHTPRPIADDWPGSDISLVDVETGTLKPFAATGASETAPLFSPDGRWLAYLVTDEVPRWAHRENIRLAPLDGGPARTLPPTPDEAPDLAGWSADSRTIYFAENRGVSELVYAQDVASGTIRPLTPAGAVADGANVNARGTWIGFVRQTTTDPTEAWASALAPFSPVKVSDVNAGRPRYPIGETRAITWTGDKGQTVEGLLTLPVGYVAGRRYPLLVTIHGGPAGVYNQTYAGAPSPYPLAVFAAEGYAVLRPNPRGSSGYGTAFRRANENDWGGGDYRDIMAGVDAVIAMGIADPERLGVLGWSYGGYMTSWIVTQTRRFKAASIGAPVTDLVSFTGTTDIPSFLPSYFGGEFWGSGDLFEVYRAHSPMAFVGNARTPAIIQQGERDMRVPISQGYELYNALKRQGVPVEMVTYPRQAHGVREPRLIVDLANRNLAWMAKYLAAPRP